MMLVYDDDDENKHDTLWSLIDAPMQINILENFPPRTILSPSRITTHLINLN